GVGESTTLTFQWLVNPSPMTLTPVSLFPVEGSATGAVTLGTFTTPDIYSSAYQFVAVVDWGDKQRDEVVGTGGQGVFTLTGGHTYTSAGTYTLTLILTKDDGSNALAAETITVSNATQTLDGDFQQGVLVGQSAQILVGVLSDTNLELAASDFTVSVNP